VHLVLLGSTATALAVMVVVLHIRERRYRQARVDFVAALDGVRVALGKLETSTADRLSAVEKAVFEYRDNADWAAGYVAGLFERSKLPGPVEPPRRLTSDS
jgi:hypothetical protein